MRGMGLMKRYQFPNVSSKVISNINERTMRSTGPTSSAPLDNPTTVCRRMVQPTLGTTSLNAIYLKFKLHRVKINTGTLPLTWQTDGTCARSWSVRTCSHCNTWTKNSQKRSWHHMCLGPVLGKHRSWVHWLHIFVLLEDHNDSVCELAGYTLGQPHGMVPHPTQPSRLQSMLWGTCGLVGVSQCKGPSPPGLIGELSVDGIILVEV